MALNSGARQWPAGPKGVPLLGNAIAFGRDPLRFLAECARRYGDLVAFRIGAWPALLVNNPDDIEYVLVKNHRGFTKNRHFWRYVRAIFGSGLLTAVGDDWQRQRRLNAPAFSGQRLASYGAVMVRYAEAMLKGWKPGVRIDVHAEIMALTLEIAAETLFGTSVKQDIAAIEQSTNVLMAEISARLRRPFFIPDGIPIPGNVRYRRALKRIDQLVTRIIAARRQSGEDRGDLLSLLLLARHENGEPMTEQQIRDEIVTMLLAGHETTALALSWTCYLLSRHPAIETRLAAELREVLGARSATVGGPRPSAFFERPRRACRAVPIVAPARPPPSAAPLGRMSRCPPPGCRALSLSRRIRNRRCRGMRTTGKDSDKYRARGAVQRNGNVWESAPKR